MLWYACGCVYVIIYIRMNVCYGIHVDMDVSMLWYTCRCGCEYVMVYM